MFDVIENLYVFFTSSTKRFALLQTELQSVTNALQLRSLSKTRWSARAESVQAVWTSFEAIHDAFLLNIVGHSNIDNKTKGKATGIINQLLNFDFIVSIMFTRHVAF